jgi:hypothetical protein
MSGKSNNDFPVIINEFDVVLITEEVKKLRTDKIANQYNYEDLGTALVLIAFRNYLESQRVPLGFRLDLYE